MPTCPFCNENLRRAARPSVPGQRPCPWCAESIGAAELLCRFCGADARQPPPPQPPASPARDFVEWEDTRRGLWSRWWDTTNGALFSLGRFWFRVPWSNDLASPLKYVAFTTLVHMLATVVCYAPFHALGLLDQAEKAVSRLRESGGSDNAIGYALGSGMGLVCAPPFFFGLIILLSFLNAAVHHLLLRVVGGRGTFLATYRAVAYSWGAILMFLLPCLGYVAFLVFYIVVLTDAFSHAHSIGKGRSFLAVSVPVLLCCGGGITAILSLPGPRG